MMDKNTYQTMLQGLIWTFMEKEKALGIPGAEKDVLTLLDLIEDLEAFWNADGSLNPEKALLQKLIYKTRKLYGDGRWRKMERFYLQKYCDRCGGSLEGGRIMSMFNEDCLCMSCKEKETKDPEYSKAVEADHDEIKRGNYNYKGIRGK